MAKGEINEWDAWYIQTDKINGLYSRLYKKSVVTKLKNFIGWRTTSVKLRIFIIEIDIERFINEDDKHAYSKLKDLIGILDLINLNETNRADINNIIEKYVYFKGKGEFKENENDKDVIEIRGYVNNISFVCNCNKKYFSEISSSFIRTLLDAKQYIDGYELNIFFLGKMRIYEHQKNLLLLDAIYIHGDTAHVDNLIKIDKNQRYR